MQPQPITLGRVIELFRRSLGTSDDPRVTCRPSCSISAATGRSRELAWLDARFRSTAIAELRRGVRGDPSPWMAATGIVPTAAGEVVGIARGDHPGQMVARLYPGQGAGDREPCWCLDRLGLQSPCLSPTMPPPISAVDAFPRRWSRRHGASPAHGHGDRHIDCLPPHLGRRLIAGIVVSFGYMLGRRS